MKEKISITNRIDQLPLLAIKVEQLGEKWEWPLPLVININLVLEEAVSNIIFYAFSDENVHEIDIEMAQNKNNLVITIADDGKPFDPSQTKQPDITLPAEEREIGGLGIFLIGKIMDEIKYKRDNNKNLLTLTKTI
jgi:serine/threonine-protein kinase RsbW